MPPSAPSSEPPSRHPDYRFTLANERTLLAWLRTALALVAGGVAVATYAPNLGARWGSAAAAIALVLLGLAAALAGYERWRANEAAIRADRPLPVSRMVPGVTLALALIVLLVTALVTLEVVRR